jgi:L-ascorbate metabolism protein UlaG (beta-lactamase superfamily)
VVVREGALRFRADTALNVAYQDRTPFGSALGGGPERAAAAAFAPVLHAMEVHGPLAATADVAAMLAALAENATFSAMVLPHPDGWRVKPEVLFPDPFLNRPRLLTVARPDTDHVVRVRLPEDFWPDVHDLTATLSVDSLSSSARGRLRPELQDFVALMEQEELLEPAPPEGTDRREAEPGPNAVTGVDVTFIGHNSVVVRSATTTALVDPLLLARSAAHPAGYQPLQLRELGAPDVVLITHSHPDHFDPASLMRVPRAATVVVPHIDQETILSVDLARRTAELGFENIRALRWGERTTIGDLRITALPFYGEQPTDTTWFHDELRNVGCTYRLDTPTTSAWFLADSGRDHLGDVARLAIDARRADGPLDWVFGGYRGWLTYPAQLLLSSVARFFFFVPPDLWQTRMTMMATADTAVDVAERCGARALVPYADGGAPWHWRLGLGPAMDDVNSQLLGFDVFPDVVADAARARSSMSRDQPIHSPVPVVLARPGQGLRLESGRPAVVEFDGHRWPYSP